MTALTLRRLAVLLLVLAVASLTGAVLIFYESGAVPWSLLALALLSFALGLELRREAAKGNDVAPSATSQS